MLLGIKTKIRELLKEDLKTLHRIFRKPDIINIFESKSDVSLTFLEKKLEELLKSEEPDGEWLVIEDLENNIVGIISYHTSRSRRGYSIQSLYIDSIYKRKGYATDAVKAIVKYLFEEKEAKRIEALVREDCTEAVSLFEKINFKQEGRRRNCAYHNGKYMDTIYLSIIDSEYLK